MRHGAPDSTDTLSKTGREEVQKMANLLKLDGFSPDYIVTSNTLRTIETTKELMKVYDVAPENTVVGEVLCKRGKHDFRLALTDLFNLDTIFVSGHAENIQFLTYNVLGEDQFSEISKSVLKDDFTCPAGGVNKGRYQIRGSKFVDTIVLSTEATQQYNKAEYRFHSAYRL